jgi:protease-4
MPSDTASRMARRVGAGLLVLAGLVLLLLVMLALGVVAVRVAGRPGPVLLGCGALAAGLAGLAIAATSLGRRLPPHTVLDLDLTEPLRDHAPGDPLATVMARGRPTLRDTVELLERSGRDRRVAGLVARVGVPAAGLADVQELRDAVAAFRAAGKFAVAYADTFGEFAQGNAGYYLAAAFDEIHLQPSGDVGLTGVATEVNFLRGALDRLGVTAQVDHRHEYKSAMNLITEQAFTPAHREATGRLVESLFEQLVTGVAQGRGLSREAVAACVDRGPLLAAEAIEAGLVDRVAYRDEVLEAVKRRAGGQARVVPLAAYRRRVGRDRRRPRASTVALIHGGGAVVRGKGRFSPLSAHAMGSDTVGAAFRQAVADRRVRAILFRVDSPGGSYVASDTIWREVARARDHGKPVVVSMGNVAASGGYFVALAATRIVAHPATLTGSIGVVAGKAVVTGLKQRVGITTDEVHRGANALIGSASQGYSTREWSRLQRWLDHVYEDFTAKVSQGRRLSPERVHEIARGRVWTGADAFDLGLVDELGGYPAALRAIRGAVGLAADARVVLRAFPRRRSLLSRLGGSADEPAERDGPAAVRRLADAAGSAFELVRRARIGEPDAVLTNPDLPTIRW